MRTTFAIILLAGCVCLSPQAQERPRILVDATRPNAVWWFQGRGGAHQGKALVDYLARRGQVEELGAHPAAGLPKITITQEMLAGRALVVRAGGGTYTDITARVLDQVVYGGEIGAYRDYVSNGGRLLLMLDQMPPGLTDGLAASFGLRFAGRSIGENRIDRVVKHPTTRSLDALAYPSGSGLVGEVPASVTVLGFLSRRTTLDLNYNGKPDAGEPAGAGAFGVFEFGRGLVFFIGETNTLQSVPQPFTNNVLSFLLGAK